MIIMLKMLIPNISKAQDITIGNYNKDWVNDTFINDLKHLASFTCQLKAKGTSNVMNLTEVFNVK